MGKRAKRTECKHNSKIPVRLNNDNRYFTSQYQVMPKEGYTKMLEKMLANPKIKVMLNTKGINKDKKYAYLIWTGPIDAFFNYKFGKLNYRSLRFEFKTYDMEYKQSVAQINYPDEGIPYTRSFEAKHATGQKCAKTTIEYEYPATNGDEYYPVHTNTDLELYRLYKEEANKLGKAFFIGRLAEFKYYNIDEAVASALQFCKRWKNP